MWTLWNYKYDMVFPQYCLLYRGITLFVFTFSSFVVVLKCIKRREDITAFWTFLFSLLLTNRSTCSAVKILKKVWNWLHVCDNFRTNSCSTTRIESTYYRDLTCTCYRNNVWYLLHFILIFSHFLSCFNYLFNLLHSVSTLSINFKIILL